jgi:ABC-2 type transport system ATP-binding protein
MRAGRLLALGTPRELQRSIPGVVLEVRAEPIRAAERALRAIPGVYDLQLMGDRLHLFADPPPDEGAARDALSQVGATLHSMRPVIPTMEDVFRYLTMRPIAERQ